MGDSARVAVVTGAGRGAGLGIATALAAHGWQVYGTGRTIDESPPWGTGIRLDHRDDAAVGRLFERIGRDHGGVDLLINNAAFVSDRLTGPDPFWRKPIELADLIDVGLRSSYVTTWHAAPLLCARPRALVAFTSSPGAVCYMHGPAYGAQKAGVDKMAADMAVDFGATGVVTVSIWMGILLTPVLRKAFGDNAAALADFSQHAETPEFTGHVIDALYRDPALDAQRGRTLIGAELARHYGLTDAEGRTPPSHRHALGSPHEPSAVVVR